MRGRMLWKTAAALFWMAAGILVPGSGPGWGMNSLAAPEDVEAMKRARIGPAVIELFLSEQTCSVTGDLLVQLKKTGADDAVLRAVILSDRYKTPGKASLTPQQWELLKKAGFSEHTLFDLSGMSPVRTVVDTRGNESIVYGFSPAGGREQAAPGGSGWNVNIEKVEKKD